MSTKAKFVALLTITVILMSLLMDSYSFSAPHKKNPEAADFLTFLIFLGVFVGLLILIVLALYIRDLSLVKKKRKLLMPEEKISMKDIVSSILSGFMLSTLFWVIRSQSRGRTVAKCVPVNGTLSSNLTGVNSTANLTNCTIVPDVGPLIGGGNETQATRFLNHPVATHLWLVFLLPFLLGLLYLAYYYIKLAKAREERRKKVEIAVEFDRKLDELGLEKFSDPKEAIVEIYKNAVLWLEGLGIPYRESWTHWEHAEHVKYMHGAFVELTRLFEKAKYAPERLSWSDAERALEVYNKLRGKARELAKID